MAIVRRTGILAKSETTYGTDPTAAGTDALIAVDGLQIAFPHEYGTIDPVDAYLDGLGHVAGQLLTTFSFTTPLRGSGTAGTAPDDSPLWKACGLRETIVAVTSVTYQPSSTFTGGGPVAGTDYQSATIHAEDGTLNVEANGCYGTCSISADAATYPKVSWQFTGLYQRPTADATITAPTYSTTRPQPSRGLTLSVHGQAGGANLRLQSFTLDLNREVHVLPDMASTFGVAAIELGRCAPSGTFTVQEQDLTKDWFAAIEAGTLAALSIAWSGGAGNIVTLTTSGGTGGMAVSEISRGDVNGVAVLECAFTTSRSSGNDSLSLAFT